MKTKKEIMEAFIEDLNTNYYTIRESAKILGYDAPTFLERKVRKLKIGYRVKGICLLSQEDVEVIKNNITRRTQKFEEV